MAFPLNLLQELVSGPGSLAKEGGGQLFFAGGHSGFTAVDEGVLILGSGSNLSDTAEVYIDNDATLDVGVSDVIGSISGAGNIQLGSGVVLRAGGNNSSTSFSGVISGDGTFVKQGSGTLTFTGSGPSTYSGATNVEAGVLNLAGSGGILNGSDVDVATGAIFDLDVSAEIGSISGAGEINLASGVILGIGADNSNSTFPGIISGLGGISKKGQGALALSGESSYVGSTEIRNGSLVVSGGLSDETDLSIAVEGMYEVAADDRVGSIDGAGQIQLGAQTLTIGNGKNTEFSGVISGVTGGLIKVGTGQFTLSGDNTYGGTTFVQAGVLTVTGSAPTGNLCHWGQFQYLRAAHSRTSACGSARTRTAARTGQLPSLSPAHARARTGTNSRA